MTYIDVSVRMRMIMMRRNESTTDTVPIYIDLALAVSTICGVSVLPACHDNEVDRDAVLTEFRPWCTWWSVAVAYNDASRYLSSTTNASCFLMCVLCQIIFNKNFRKNYLISVPEVNIKNIYKSRTCSKSINSYCNIYQLLDVYMFNIFYWMMSSKRLKCLIQVNYDYPLTFIVCIFNLMQSI